MSVERSLYKSDILCTVYLCTLAAVSCYEVLSLLEKNPALCHSACPSKKWTHVDEVIESIIDRRGGDEKCKTYAYNCTYWNKRWLGKMWTMPFLPAPDAFLTNCAPPSSKFTSQVKAFQWTCVFHIRIWTRPHAGIAEMFQLFNSRPVFNQDFLPMTVLLFFCLIWIRKLSA